MPTTTYNIDRILNKVPEESRETIREVLNEIQLIVYSENCLQTQKIDTNGMPPYLATTLDVYEYECPSDCRETEAIFCLSKSMIRSDVGRLVEPYGKYYYNNKEYVQEPIRQLTATNDVAAKLWFKNNPGTTTTTYFHLYYIKPTVISSEEIQLTIPENKHWLMRKAVIAMLTSEKYGESQFDEVAMLKVARAIRNSLNRGCQSGTGITEVRDEYRDGIDRGYGYRK